MTVLFVTVVTHACVPVTVFASGWLGLAECLAGGDVISLGSCSLPFLGL